MLRRAIDVALGVALWILGTRGGDGLGRAGEPDCTVPHSPEPPGFAEQPHSKDEGVAEQGCIAELRREVAARGIALGRVRDYQLERVLAAAGSFDAALEALSALPRPGWVTQHCGPARATRSRAER